VRATISSIRLLAVAAVSILVISVDLLSILGTAAAQEQDQYPDQYQDQYPDQYQTPSQYQTSDQYGMAGSPVGSFIFFPVPDGAGGTYYCSSGPPFVSDTDPSSPQANCTPYQSGEPSGFTCDTPTDVTFLPTDAAASPGSPYYAGGQLCDDTTNG